MERQIILLAHNIRSLWNIGSLFRACDAFGVKKLYLTGYTATPPRREISKTAIGADEWVEWEQKINPFEVIKKLRKEDFKIIALEQTSDAVDISKFKSPDNVCLVVGHEVTGIPDEVLSVCDEAIHIPMHGKKESLNVAVAAGIALFALKS